MVNQGIGYKGSWAMHENDIDGVKSCKQLRNYLGLDQGDFARALGVEQPTVSRWESGARPTPAWLAYAVKGMKFTHDGKTGCYCALCDKRRSED